MRLKVCANAAKALAKSGCSLPTQASAQALSAEQGLYSLIIVEIKDLTYNAQFNFCLLHPEVSRGAFDRSEFAHFASLGFHQRLRSRVTNSRIKLSKIAALMNFRATKKLNLGADFGLASHDARSLSGQD